MFRSTVLASRGAIPKKAIKSATLPRVLHRALPITFSRHIGVSHNAKSLAVATAVTHEHFETIPTHQSRAEVLNVVIGQRLRIPDVGSQFEGWPFLSNPHKDSVTEGVNEILRKSDNTLWQPRLISDEARSRV